MLKAIYPMVGIILLSACDSDDTSSQLQGRRDAATISITPDGLYDVLCKNGEKQLVTEEDFLADKVCERPPVLCGAYEENEMNTLSGTYIVTCNTTFKGMTTIEGGTKLLADDGWNIAFDRVKALGTAAKPIVFDFSLNSVVKYWKNISFRDRAFGDPVTGPEFNPKDGYIQGSYLSHVQFSNIKEGLTLENLYATQVSAQKAALTTIKGSFVKGSSFNTDILQVDSNLNPSYLINNKLKILTFSFSNRAYDSFLSHNTMELSRSYFYPHNSVMTFNSISEVDSGGFCRSSDDMGFVAANHFDNAQIVECLGPQRFNTVGELPDFDLITNFPIKRNVETKAGQPVTIKFMALNRNDFLFNRSIKVEAFYKIDGAEYKADAFWEGFSPRIAIQEKESYDIVPSLVDSSRPFVLGFDRIILDVY